MFEALKIGAMQLGGYIGLLFFGAIAGYFIFFKWEQAQANMRQQGKNFTRLQAIVMWAVMTALFAFLTIEGHAEQRKLPGNIQSIAQAQEHLLGTWTYTSPLDSNNKYVATWIKWVVHPNGLVESYYAKPNDNDWGPSQNKQYEVFTAKYTDTGERFYAITPTKSAEVAVIKSNGSLTYTIRGEGGVAMKKGDRFPFSQ